MRMLRRLRRSALPSAARAALSLQSGERVISHAPTDDGSHLVATDRALHLPGGVRIAWEQIEHAEWRTGGLHVRETAPWGQVAPEHNVRVAYPRSLPEAIRERVAASIVINQYLPLDERRGIRVVGRRRPGANAVAWSLVFDPGLDPGDPEIRAHAESLLADVRRQTGL